ncbi:hypothetical protein CC79DRAFT_1352851 [Sarocladium strictum]
MPPTQKRKRGRPAAAAGASTTDQDASQPTTTAERSRKRAKASPQAASERPTRGGKRTKQSPAAASAKRTTKPGSPAGRKRRSSLQEVQPDEAQNQTAPKKANARKKRKSEQVEEEGEAQAAPAGRKRGPKPRQRASVGGSSEGSQRRSSVNNAQTQQQPTVSEEPATRRRRRRSSAATVESEDQSPPSPPKPYPHIARSTRRIRRSHISSKWSPLTGSSLTAVNTILTLAHRPILQRLSQTSQRRQHTFAALRLITNRINRRLARGIPFPPASTATGPATGAHEVELNFEAVLDGRAVLERQLDPGLHAVELLKREKKRIEGELEKDYETLRNLEAGARGQARQQRELLKKAHVLAPVGMKREDDWKQEQVVFKRENPETKTPAFTDIQDHDVKDVVTQLGGHAESMRANLEQAEGIMPEITKSRAALQSVLMKHLDKEQYERVVLG